MYTQLAGIVDLVADEDSEVASLIAAENLLKELLLQFLRSNLVRTLKHDIQLINYPLF